MKPPISRWGLRDRGNVILVVGPVGTGKSVFAYNAADGLHGERTVYCSMSEQHDRPEYYRPSTGGFHDNAVELVTDSSLSLHARQYMAPGNVVMDMQSAVRRHNNLDIIYDVQNAGTLDLNAIRAADCIVLKGPPSPAQLDTERPAIVKRYERAFRYLGVPEYMQDDYEGPASTWDLDNAFVTTNRTEFMVEGIRPPPYWNEEISEDDIMKRRDPVYTKIPGWVAGMGKDLIDGTVKGLVK